MKIIAPVCVLIIMLCVISAGCVAEEKNLTKEAAMTDVMTEILDRLNTAVEHISDAADEIAAGKNDDISAKNVLAELYQKTTLAQSILFADENQIVIAAYPDIIKGSVGKNVSIYGTDEKYFGGDNVRLSKYMLLEDKSRACVLSVPVYDKGEFKGYISVAFDTYRLLGSVNDNLNEKYGYNMWVAQTDGDQIYDPDLAEVGVNIMTDANYSEQGVHNAVTEITGNNSGTVQYSFKGDKTDNLVTKEAYWDTFTYGGQDWRVVITSVQ